MKIYLSYDYIGHYNKKKLYKKWSGKKYWGMDASEYPPDIGNIEGELFIEYKNTEETERERSKKENKRELGLTFFPKSYDDLKIIEKIKNILEKELSGY